MKAAFPIVLPDCIKEMVEEVLKQADASFGPVIFEPSNSAGLDVRIGVAVDRDINEVERALRLIKLVIVGDFDAWRLPLVPAIWVRFAIRGRTTVIRNLPELHCG